MRVAGLGLERAHRPGPRGRACEPGATTCHRPRPPAPAAPARRSWDPAAGSIDAGALDGADAVVHLAGAGIGDKRWSAARRHEIVSSRVQSTTLLARTLAGLGRPPAVLVSASAVGYYGDRGDEELTEDERRREPGSWPRCAAPGRTPPSPPARPASGSSGCARASCCRPDGGALARQLPAVPPRASGGRLGSGRQWLSWISLPDEVGAILHALDDARPRGPGQRHGPDAGDQPRLHRAPWAGPCTARRCWPCPAFALRSRSGPTSPSEMVLAGQRVLPAELLDHAATPSTTPTSTPRRRRTGLPATSSGGAGRAGCGVSDAGGEVLDRPWPGRRRRGAGPGRAW